MYNRNTSTRVQHPSYFKFSQLLKFIPRMNLSGSPYTLYARYLA